MKVMKFGGGCLRDAASVSRVVDIILSQTTKPVVVVSALYGITDMLEEGLLSSLKSEKKVSPTIHSIRDRHQTLVEEVIADSKIRHETTTAIEDRIKKLEQLLYGASYTGEITKSVQALILSFGERLAAVALAGALLSLDQKSVALESEEAGIITDECFENATAILPLVKKNLRSRVLPYLRKGFVPVLTGYFGCTPEKKITTFGRNGSDYSSAVIAFGTEATQLEIWKDVDGFMSADPKIVKKPHRILRLSYYEAAELSYFGAKILHPRTVEPLVKKPIPIFIRNVSGGERESTVIMPSGYESQDVIKGVTCNKNISILRIHGPGVGYKPGVIAEIAGILFEKGINIYSVLTAQTCINLLVDKSHSQKSIEALNSLAGGVIERIDLESQKALIAVVGEGLLKRKGVAARIFSRVAEENINIEMISCGASEVAYYFIVEAQDAEKAVNAIHREFFERRENVF